VTRIIDTERKRKNLPAAIALLEKRWPERSRQHFEWSMLGDLYKETQDDARALAAYERAVKKAPTEVETQRKVIALLDKLRPADALKQHEAAARLAPGDADLQIALAKRYYPADTPKALATLEKLAKRLSRNVNVRRTIAGLYDQWDQPAKAILEYEAIVAIEPDEVDHVVTLGDAYWRGNQLDKAKEAWSLLAKINTAASLFRHGEVLFTHDMFAEAAEAYTKSLALDGTNPEVWRGRANAYDSLGKYAEATSDARRAVALIGIASRDDGNRERHLLVRVLGHGHDSGDGKLAESVKRWRFAFEHGDIAAGYLLVAHHSRIASGQHHEVLLALFKRVPNDDSLAFAVARSYGQRKDFARAKKELENLAKRSPKKTDEINKLLARLEEDRIRYEQDARWEDEGLSERERQRRRAGGLAPDLVGSDRGGARLVIGSDVKDASGAILGLGIYRSYNLAVGTSLPLRFDWTQRDDEMEEVNAISIGIGIERRLIDARRFELAVGASFGAEVRFGSSANESSWDRGALAGDLMLEVLPRAIPATLGLRYRQELTESPRSGALLFELGFEVR
jgi:tetratricopeptide (TPR) repeat protein